MFGSKIKVFISIELPYWFKTSFWPKILEIYCMQYAKDNFTRDEPNIRKLKKLGQVEF